MATKRPLKFNKNKHVRSMARKQVGNPAPSRVLDERPVRAKPKYKENWLQEAEK